MTTLLEETIAALRRNHDDLAARVAGFDEEDLARQSGCSQWDVAQVLGHLGSGAEIGLATLRAGLAGEKGRGQEDNQAVWSRWNAMGRREKAAGFLHANEQLVSGVEGLDVTARQELKVELGFLPFPADAAVLTGMRLNEAALHGWDVRVAFDAQATVTAEEAGIALENLAGRLGVLLGFLARGAGPDMTEATLRVETTDPDRVLGLALGQNVSLSEASDRVDGVLSGPAEAFLRLLSGRLGAGPAGLTVVSDKVTLDQLQQTFPGF